MTGRGCKVFLASILQFLNYLQTFVGVTIIVYSFWMFSHWNHHYHIPPPSAPSPESGCSSMLNLHSSDVLKNRKLIENSEHILFDKLAGLISSHLECGRSSNFEKLPPPWFIYFSMSTGITLCLINFIGYIAAETINGCCLFFYFLLATILILVEAAFVVYILLNRQWETVLPYDPTGEFDNLRSFIQENIEVCEMVGVVVIIIQVLSVLLAIILRAMVTRREDCDYENEDDYHRVNHRQPLTIPQEEQSSASTSEDSKSNRPDGWSLRMREKYGLNPHDFRGAQWIQKAHKAAMLTKTSGNASSCNPRGKPAVPLWPYHLQNSFAFSFSSSRSLYCFS